MPAHLLYRLLIVGLWLLCASAAHAEGGFCPPGTIDHNNGRAAAIVCSPIPGYGQQRAPQPPPQQWERRWGAIAGDKPKGILGTAVDKTSKREAEQAALSDCATNGGSPCKVEASYANECVAMVVGAKGYGIYVGDSQNAAIQRANQQLCPVGGDTDCRTLYTACSLPVRIR
ncbi:DUF4189 domain-containing protein [Variovorax sp. AFSI2.2]|uniref:DUF4189 domain-containing protein n=1 Tax=Variovorax sp. AFSI2.2 TaxID=3384160 RepID=UPI003EBC0F91